jgi:hypothetical protein
MTHTTREALEATRDGWAAIGAPAIGERFVLRNGQTFTGAKRPRGVRRGTPNNCFQNTTHQVTDNPELRYVEGYTTHKHLPFPILHAWAIDADDRVIDVTLKTPEEHEYMGVVVARHQLWRELHRTKVYGLFDHGLGMNVHWMFRRDPGLKDEIEPVLAIRGHKVRDLIERRKA